MKRSFSWSPMMAADLPTLLAIADIVHPNYPEDPAVFAERLELYPQGCLVLEGTDGLVGYIVSHPWLHARPPGLNSLLKALPTEPTTYYIHDIALLPAARGSGAATNVVSRLKAHAEAMGLPSLTLTAVNNSADFWHRFGFREAGDAALAAKLATYDADARFMALEILREGA